MGSGTGDGTWSVVVEWWVPTVTLMALGALTTVVWVQVATPSYALLDIMLPTGLGSLAVWQGLRLRREDSFEDHGTVVRWFTVGLVVMGCLGLWPVFLRAAGQSTVPVGVRLLTEIIAGGLLALLVGIHSVRARQSAEEATQARVEREFLERQREANDLLNRTLRHQLLNSLTVVRGRAELLADRSDPTEAQWARTVVERTDQMTKTVDDIANITRTLTEGTDVEPLDLASVVETQASLVREAFPGATVTVDAGPDCTVRGDALLGRALGNVLENAVEHNDSDAPTVVVEVTTTDDEAVVVVSDDGPGIPEPARDRVFDANERGLESDGDGLGLFLTASVLRQYGGEVSLVDGPLEGASVALRVPLAAADRPVDPATETAANPWSDADERGHDSDGERPSLL